MTKIIALLAGVVFILSKILPLFNLGGYLDFLILRPADFLRLPWTLVTYPLVSPDFLTVLFAALWLWFIGGSLERSWGSTTYGIFLFLVTLVTGLAMVVASIFTPFEISVHGLWLPLVGLTWAWGAINPDREVLFWGIIPIKAQWLAWIDAAITFFAYLAPHFLYGIASVSGIAVVYLFTGRGPLAKGYRYWAWRRGFSAKNDSQRKKTDRSRFRVIK